MLRTQPADLDGQLFDLVVIGGGINGAAIARDAALRGLSVLLLEKGDFASGTTSWSTRLIHGGLRYLEHREFGLVRESLRERERLLRNAPHLVQPLPLYIPIYDRSKRGYWTIKAGMTLYDLLSYDKSLPRHTMLSRGSTLEVLPQLDPAGLKGAACYYDAQVAFPERLVIENLLDAAANGGLALNYARVDSLLADGFVARGVTFTDLLTGAHHEVRARATINVAGPWVDQVLRAGQHVDQEKPLIGATKGAHCFISPPASGAFPPIYCEAKSDGRAFFILPWNGLIMIGTTDTRFTGNLDNVMATPEDVDYLIAEARVLLPHAGISADDVLFTYAGVRPLPSTGEGMEAGITRRHFVVDHAPTNCGLFSIVGGKLTTHRSLAGHAVDTVCDYLGAQAPCQTASRPLPGAGEPMYTDHPLATETTDRLHSLYGSRARIVIGLGLSDPALLEPLTADSQAIAAEVLFAFQHEQAAKLTDVLLRRMMTAYTPDMGLAIAKSAANVARLHLGWSDDHATAELSAYVNAIKKFQPRALNPTPADTQTQ